MNKQYTAKDEVLLRRFYNGDVIAIFPYIPADLNGGVTSYMHIGQHAAADLSLIYHTRLANPKDEAVKDLLHELRQIGYNPKIIHKTNYERYHASRKALAEGGVE